MISPNAEPIRHESPYAKIDIRHPGRKRVITALEWLNSGAIREPDPSEYRRDPLREIHVIDYYEPGNSEIAAW